ncbi:MAG: serine/threonine protein kinase, partial [Myxococcaceae bacterium]
RLRHPRIHVAGAGGGAQLDHRSDLYAVGVILYQLTTGLLPFESDSAVGFATKHLTAEPPAPSRRRPDAKITQGMERLILRALAKDPNDRPQTADAFRLELLALLDQRPGTRSHAPPRRPSGASQQVLQQIPRKVTPAEQADTRVEAKDSPWGAAEQTVRTAPGSLVTNGGATVADTKPGNTMRPPKTASQPAAGGSMLPFKLLTIALVLISIGLGWYYFTQLNHGPTQTVEQPLPNNVPVPGQFAVDPNKGPDKTPDMKAYDKPPPPQVETAKADALIREGDIQYDRGEVPMAITKYKEAFEKDPRPELSLRLGEVNYRRNQPNEAKGWWARHLKDSPDSKARRYILQIFPELAQKATE